MNPLTANFAELYRRHLHRHSEPGVNVNHVVSVSGVYLCLFGLLEAVLRACGVPDGWRAGGLAAATLPYLAVIGSNVPRGVLASVAFTLAGLLGVCLLLAPFVPWWAWLVAMPLCHQLQQVGHRFTTREYDMAEFSERYPKGSPLFRLLAVYELPILLNYFREGTAPLGEKQPLVRG